MQRLNSKPMYIYGQEELSYRFNGHHPFDQRRLPLTSDLLRAYGALEDRQVIQAPQATEEQLQLVHHSAYLDIVKRLSVESPDEESISAAERAGLAGEDTPYFPGMHLAASHIVGGTIRAVEAVVTGQCEHALHLGGGLHHALSGRAAGFCVYNDAAAAIAAIKLRYPELRILYIDTDVHHGDGVQWAFYSDPSVCTLSIHETGKYLYPGTGGANERGDGEGFGTSVNIPVEPYTEDNSWLHCFQEALERTAAFFKPDLLLTQHGCDAHAYDPLSHLHCSMDIYLEMPRLIHQAAHRFCEGRWVALGGGGYEIWRVVPRAWSMLWLEMNDDPLYERLKQDRNLPLPASWLKRYETDSPVELPATWLDPSEHWTPMPRRNEIEARNLQALDIALLYMPQASGT